MTVTGPISAAAVSVINVPTSGLQVIDGQAVAAGQTVLLVGQATASQNGLWVAATGAWARHSSFPTGSALAAVAVTVTSGAVWAGTSWQPMLAGSAVTVDTSPQWWYRR
ncbi:MAG: hypothetical protein KGQ66_13105 [Acidobacteriota bacterium]|nr:hypothetical protein [Acidobacteriota bacterium]